MSNRIIWRFVRVDVLALVPIFAYDSLAFTTLVVFEAVAVVSSFARAVGLFSGRILRLLSSVLHAGLGKILESQLFVLQLFSCVESKCVPTGGSIFVVALTGKCYVREGVVSRRVHRCIHSRNRRRFWVVWIHELHDAIIVSDRPPREFEPGFDDGVVNVVPVTIELECYRSQIEPPWAVSS